VEVENKSSQYLEHGKQKLSICKVQQGKSFIHQLTTKMMASYIKGDHPQEQGNLADHPSHDVGLPHIHGCSQNTDGAPVC
jgi:hypothetical protein